MSPDMPATIPRTAACASDSEQGWAAEQLVPVPDGEAYTVVVAARAGGATATTTAAVAAAVAAAAVTSPRTAEDGGARPAARTVRRRTHAVARRVARAAPRPGGQEAGDNARTGRGPPERASGGTAAESFRGPGARPGVDARLLNDER